MTKSSGGSKKSSGGGSGSKAVAQVNSSNEKSTLGDLDALSAFKI